MLIRWKRFNEAEEFLKRASEQDSCSDIDLYKAILDFERACRSDNEKGMEDAFDRIEKADRTLLNFPAQTDRSYCLAKYHYIKYLETGSQDDYRQTLKACSDAQRWSSGHDIRTQKIRNKIQK